MVKIAPCKKISGQTYTTITGYNAKRELTGYTYPDGTAVGRSYKARGELYQLTYGWDANKNKTSEAIAGTMSNYGFTVPTNGYDSEDRLVGFNRTSGLTQSWNLSAVGDWNSVTTNGSTETRTHGPTHELLTGAGQNATTDTKGNITLISAAISSFGAFALRTQLRRFQEHWQRAANSQGAWLDHPHTSTPKSNKLLNFITVPMLCSHQTEKLTLRTNLRQRPHKIRCVSRSMRCQTESLRSSESEIKLVMSWQRDTSTILHQPAGFDTFRQR